MSDPHTTQPNREAVYFPPDTNDFQVGEVFTNGDLGHYIILGFFEGHQVYGRAVHTHLGRVALPFLTQRMETAKKHAHANVQFQAEAMYGYTSPVEEAERFSL